LQQAGPILNYNSFVKIFLPKTFLRFFGKKIKEKKIFDKKFIKKLKIKIENGNINLAFFTL
jgi:hypothetical protein